MVDFEPPPVEHLDGGFGIKLDVFNSPRVVLAIAIGADELVGNGGDQIQARQVRFQGGLATVVVFHSEDVNAFVQVVGHGSPVAVVPFVRQRACPSCGQGLKQSIGFSAFRHDRIDQDNLNGGWIAQFHLNGVAAKCGIGDDNLVVAIFQIFSNGVVRHSGSPFEQHGAVFVCGELNRP